MIFRQPADCMTAKSRADRKGMVRSGFYGYVVQPFRLRMCGFGHRQVSSLRPPPGVTELQSTSGLFCDKVCYRQALPIRPPPRITDIQPASGMFCGEVRYRQVLSIRPPPGVTELQSASGLFCHLSLNIVQYVPNAKHHICDISNYPWEKSNYHGKNSNYPRDRKCQSHR